MSRITNQIKQSLYYRANLLFPGFFKKRFFSNVSRGLTDAAQVGALPEKEMLVLYFLLKPGNVTVDVGANHGAYSYFFKVMTKSARVLAFEPLPDLFKKLRRWFSDIELFNLALSDAGGTATLRIPVIANRLFQSRAKLDQLKEEHETDAKELTIRIDTLDRVAETAQLQRLDLIKIDIEGHELKAIAGAAATIKRFRPWLLVEIEARHHGGSITPAVNTICAHGYAAWYFDFVAACLQPIAGYNVTDMQDPRRQNTFAYINNFLFMPLGSEKEIAGINQRLAAYLRK